MSNEVKQTAKRGRPVVNGSKRQAVLAMRQAKRDAGLEIKRGRPKTKTEDVSVTVKAKAPKAKSSKADRQAKLAANTEVVDVMSLLTDVDDLA